MSGLTPLLRGQELCLPLPPELGHDGFQLGPIPHVCHVSSEDSKAEARAVQVPAGDFPHHLRLGCRGALSLGRGRFVIQGQRDEHQSENHA